MGREQTCAEGEAEAGSISTKVSANPKDNLRLGQSPGVVLSCVKEPCSHAPCSPATGCTAGGEDGDPE